MPLHDIFLAVPAFDRKAEARAADLDVRPAAGPLGTQEINDAGAVSEQLPAAVGLFADEAVAGAGVAMA